MSKRVLLTTVVISILLLQIAFAQDFKWQNYVGTTQWSVDVIEDESSCGGGTTTSTHTISIQQSFDSAEVGDYGHGVMKGTFTNNALHILAHTIDDPPGSSKLGSFDVIFSSDCSSFVGQYDWDYSGPEQSCSGTTGLKGTRLDGPGCPEIGQAKSLPNPNREISSEEQGILDRLAQNPDDFWANWDMAELKKKQGKYDEFFDYLSRAINNENISPETKEKMKEEELKKLHISDFPTRDTSPFLRIEEKEVTAWNGGPIYDVDVSRSKVNGIDGLKFLLWRTFDTGSNDIVTRIALR